MSWRRPTEDDIIATISVAEIEAYKQSANWDRDPIEILCNRAAAYARDAIRTNGNVVMSPDEREIPESCISPAMDYLALDIAKRIGGAATEERREARKEAAAYFERIATGKLIPESYNASGEAVSGGPAAEIVMRSRHRITPPKVEGL